MTQNRDNKKADVIGQWAMRSNSITCRLRYAIEKEMAHHNKSSRLEGRRVEDNWPFLVGPKPYKGSTNEGQSKKTRFCGFPSIPRKVALCQQ